MTIALRLDFNVDTYKLQMPMVMQINYLISIEVKDRKLFHHWHLRGRSNLCWKKKERKDRKINTKRKKRKNLKKKRKEFLFGLSVTWLKKCFEF